jgi:hypothetical protein
MEKLAERFGLPDSFETRLLPGEEKGAENP